MGNHPGNRVNYAVLWDMDGVLVDTGEFHYQSWAETLSGYGIALDRETFRRSFGMNNAGTLAAFLGHPPEPEALVRIVDDKERAFLKAIAGKARLLPGVLGTLQLLKAEGAPMAIASSAPEANIQALVKELRLQGYFAAILSGSEMPGKPDPAVFLAAARRLEFPPERCVVVEDSIAGVEAARRAGMKCIAVTTTNPGEALQAADIVVSSLADLEEGAFLRLAAG